MSIRRCIVGLMLIVVGVATAMGADWPMRGRDQTRNAVVADAKGPTDWEIATGETKVRNIRWTANLGTVSCGDPIIAGGLVWVGTNNGRPRDKGNATDAGVLMCFRERDGAFLYQHVSPRLESRELDWPMSGLASSPLVEGDRLWFCTNRCEVICLDIAPLRSQTGAPRIVWKVDMRKKLGVVPRGVMIGSNLSQCSVAAYKDLIFVNTTNASGYDSVPAPDAPSLVCFQKNTGAVKWKDNSPGKNLLNVQNGNPLAIEIEGRGQVIMGQGDAWVRGFDATTGELLWKFDINPKSAKKAFVAGDRSDLVAMPVYYDGRVYFAVGRHFEWCSGQGAAYCIDPTKRGDISSELADGSGQGLPNPNSGLVWQYLGRGDRDDERMHRTLSSVAINEGLVIAPDLSGVVHCLDARTGEGLWSHDTQSQIASSPLIVGSTAYVCTETSTFLFELSRRKRVIAERSADSAIEASPVYANGVLYVTGRGSLVAIGN